MLQCAPHLGLSTRTAELALLRKGDGAKSDAGGIAAEADDSRL